MKLKRDLKLPLSILMLASALGCATQEKKIEIPGAVKVSPDSRGIDEFEKANQLLDARRYEEAAAAFDRLRVQKPATTLDFFILLNGGIAYQSAGDCKTAAERYRQTIRVTNKKNPQTQAMARLRLSDVLACQGDDRLAIVNLVELYKSRSYLPIEIAQAEVPARLAAAYARADNKKMAQKYFKEAEIGFRKVNTMNATEAQKPMLAKTLFLMGNMAHLDPAKISAQDYFVSVDALQGFLYRAAEMDVANWSDLAVDQLQDAYQKVWMFIDRDQPTSEDSPELSAREMKVQKIQAAQSALSTMKELTNLYVPSKKPNKRLTLLFATLDKTERQIEGFLATNRLGNDLTPEAKKATDVKQDGRLVDPNRRR